MSGWSSKLRGVLTLGGLGAVGGALVGAAWSVAQALIFPGAAGGIYVSSVLASAGLWGVLGGAATSGLAVILATLGSKKTLSELHAWQGGVAGALAGALAPLGLALVMAGGFHWFLMGPVMGMSAGMGGALGAGLLFAAKRAEAAELALVEEAAALNRGD